MDNPVSWQVKMEMGPWWILKVKVSVELQIKKKKRSKYIQKVLLVPDLDKNILSIGQLVEHSYSVHF